MSARLGDAHWYSVFPDDLVKGQTGLNSKKKAWFHCLAGHGHPDFDMALKSRREGRGCPEYPCNPKRVKGDVGWYALFTDLVKGQTGLKSNKIAQFHCLAGHGHPDFEMRLNNRQKGRGCPEYPCNPAGKRPLPKFPITAGPPRQPFPEGLIAIPIPHFLQVSAEIARYGS